MRRDDDSGDLPAYQPVFEDGWRTRLASLPRLTRDGHGRHCPICDGTGQPFCTVDFLRVCDDVSPQAFGFSGVPIAYFRCLRCQFLWAPAMHAWSSEDFARFVYNEDYALVDPDYAEARPKRIARKVSGLLEALGPLRILDYGSGSGATARALEACGFCDVACYDPFSHPQRPEERFDLVLAFEVIEHSPDPIGTFRDMVGFLDTGGAILAGVALQPRDIETLGAGWWYLGPRNGHVSTYSVRTLAMIAERMDLDLVIGDGIYGFSAGPSISTGAMLERLGHQRSTLLLRSPGPTSQTSEWHGVETVPGGRFRWTAADTVTWRDVWLNRGTTALRFPVRMQVQPGIADGCHVTLDGTRIPLRFDNGVLCADLVVATQGVRDLVLHTPPLGVPATLYGSADQRRLGLAIDCEAS